MIKKTVILFIHFGFLLVSNVNWAQENPDDIAVVDNEIENNFYDALRERAIENYDKAIIALEKCIAKKPDDAAIHYELGKNFLDLKKYAEAEQSFQKAVDLNSKERWYWNGLYDVYYITKDFQKSIPIVQKLTEFDPNMKEDLVSLYVYTNQNEKALALIQEMEKNTVISETLKNYKKHLSLVRTTNSNEKSLIDAIKANPKNEQAYIDLMVFYSQQNQEEKAIDVAKQLAKEIPNSEWAAISLFKLYLNENNGVGAADSMLKVLKNKNVEKSIKHKFLNEFLIYTSNSTQFEKELNQAVDILSSDKSINVAKEVAKFYYNKKNYEKTSFFLEKALTNQPEDWEAIELLLDNLSNAKKYEELGNRAEIFIDLFPAQPKLYYYAGYAKNKAQNYKQAIDFLETGLEFVVDDTNLEKYFCIQLAEAYAETGNSKKTEEYRKRAEALLKK